MTRESIQRPVLLVGISVALLLGTTTYSRGGELLQAAAKAKQTGLPLFVMFSSPTCKYCVEMKKRLKTDAELNKLITTQYVFVEADAGDADSKQFIEHYNVKVDGVPHTCIVSAMGELVAESGGLPPGDGLARLLKEGIEKTGGMKTIASATPKKISPVTKLEQEALDAVLKDIAASKEKLSSEDSILEGMIDLLAINRKYSRVSEVKKETGPIFGEINKNKAQKEILVQARMLDAAAAAIEVKKDKLAESTYQSVIKKYPDSAAAKYAQTKLDAMGKSPTGTEAAAHDAKVAQSGEEPATK